MSETGDADQTNVIEGTEGGPENLSEIDPDTESDVERAARRTPPGKPLRVRDLRKEFGGLTAVDGVSFDIEEGSLTGLIGPNGAGKSTTFDCITGVHRPTGGSVHLRDEEITGLRPHRIANRGLVRTFQITRELTEMTVLENMLLAPRGQRGESLWRSVLPGARGGVRTQERELRDRAWETLERFEIDHLAEEYAGNLSGGQRKLLEMARALLTDPDVVLLDEPLAGVNPTLERKLLAQVHELREEGYTFLLVEHDMDVIMEHCERVIVMHQGRVLADDDPETVRADERVIDAYLGANV
ncbi:ABC transporter ATP-binding protein [Halococcus hamelinensis]|uniref:Probable branched-chain amino acid transport ATP-binding protein LivG n=1 Tax=Halococcus hamelinensis 100A6 TaxID=1132509 RepID=M0M1W2_9EURY|nr:ABC transporter ATP-binding protein [Halococcus hamelinensis]EMA38390.1 branched chain amino acid ABC transporter ATP-binding protein [Halococcus hamelinensis 100A6]